MRAVPRCQRVYIAEQTRFFQDVAIREMMGVPVVSSKYTVSQKTSTFYFLNNSVDN